ncbi:MAG TPA: hypothetical protein PLD20_05845 [Blastocatellia bacterium]|nr:hypothetical protein [Blastocatellia bacterium]HMV87603.1 hypothetical protein [Blastocatellia bacterium]HMX24709.1 hypothetical protein [Blastocatellia bacterium]HMY73356.1 hypothetical protein [Blastocatellia bacterium]HMZ17430.1 hypothetical protein [Blastocatellia bacterium]
MLTERDTTSNEPLHDYNQPEPPEAKPRKKRAQRRKRVVEDAPTPRVESGQVKVKADFTMPVERFARLAEEEFDDDEEETEEVEEIDSRDYRHLLYGNGVAPMSIQPGVVAETHSESVREHLRQVSEEATFTARIWRVPSGFAIRHPLIRRKPKSAPGWAYQSDLPYDPETIEGDVLQAYGDGHYFIEVRENGRFQTGMLITVGDPASVEVQMTPTTTPQGTVYEATPAPPPDPVKEAQAQAKIIDTMTNAYTRLLEVQSHQQPVQPPEPPSLKERLEELRLMQQMFAPQQPAASHADPMEKLAAALESESIKRILSTIKSDNPVAPVEPQTSIWDFLSGAMETLAPGLNPLLAGAGRYLAGLAQASPAQSPAPTNPSRPTQIPAPVESPAVGSEEITEEDNGVISIQFLLQDLINQVPAEQTAQKVRQIANSYPLIKPLLKQYLAKDNAVLWEEFIARAQSDGEAATLREGLAECTWKDDWLNALKKHLQS